MYIQFNCLLALIHSIQPRIASAREKWSGPRLRAASSSAPGYLATSIALSVLKRNRSRYRVHRAIKSRPREFSSACFSFSSFFRHFPQSVSGLHRAAPLCRAIDRQFLTFLSPNPCLPFTFLSLRRKRMVWWFTFAFKRSQRWFYDISSKFFSP